jgi:hypothetical protein
MDNGVIPVFVRVEPATNDGVTLRLFGGPARDAGCTDPGEPVELFEVREDSQLWRVPALLGRTALSNLARTLAGGTDLEVRGELDQLPFNVYDCRAWKTEDWLAIVRQTGTVVKEEKDEAGYTRIWLHYSDLHLWKALSWGYTISPFDPNWHFLFSDGDDLCQRWIGINDDYSDLEIELTNCNSEEVLARVAAWCSCHGYQLFQVDRDLRYEPGEPQVLPYEEAIRLV